VCNQFEDALKAGTRPHIEDYLCDCPADARDALRCEMLQLEAHYCAGANPAAPTVGLDIPTAPTADPPPVSERYTPVAGIGEGGMGRVALCHDHEMGRRVALKQLRPELAHNPEARARFEHEARITGRLAHPSIVPVYELVKPPEGHSPFYTMRFVQGDTLTEATRIYHNRRRANEPVALDLLRLLNAFVNVCQAVAYAHSQGVLHRDLKGSNVVLGAFGEVIVLDWGLAKLLGTPDEHTWGAEPTALHGHTLPGAVKGTPQYMAPEQAAGQVELLGPRTDVYGLGAILYEILAGVPPFSGSSADAVIAKVRAGNPERPSTHVPEVAPELEVICLKALAREPIQRHESAAELADAVERFLADASDRSRAQQARERFFTLSFDLLCTVGFDERFHQLNPAWERTLGWSGEELGNQPYLDFVYPDDRDHTRAAVREVMNGAERPPFENRFRCKDGGHRWVSWSANLIRGEQLVYAVGRDVTELKDAGQALQRSQERFELAVRGSGDGLWDWDRETGESFYSPRWKGMIGHEDHEIPHDIAEWEVRVHPDDRERALAALRSCIEGESPSYEVEYRFRHKDGSYIWILDRGVAVRNARGEVSRMAGSHTDITERRRMEQALRESEQRHQMALAEMAAELARCRAELASASSRPDPVGGT